MSRALERVLIIGAGKVGRALQRASRSAGLNVRLRAWRKGPPTAPIDAQIVVLALRDRELGGAADALRDGGRLSSGRSLAVVHCAGSLGPEVLATLRSRTVSVGQMHPLLAFADPRTAPPLAGAMARVSGDPLAVRRATQLARRLGMRPHALAGVEPHQYHAAAALLANGAIGLAAAARELLGPAVDEETAWRALAPLLSSVAHNLGALGLPEALTGPVRRGNVTAVRAHLDHLRSAAPHFDELYRASARAQLALARPLAEASPEAFDEIEKILSGL